jgi:hypothetical protein
MKYEKALLFAAGAVFGIGTACFVKSRTGKKVAVAIAGKGLELKDCVAGMAERVKETVDDVMAEARCINEQKANVEQGTSAN